MRLVTSVSDLRTSIANVGHNAYPDDPTKARGLSLAMLDRMADAALLRAALYYVFSTLLWLVGMPSRQFLLYTAAFYAGVTITHLVDHSLIVYVMATLDDKQK